MSARGDDAPDDTAPNASSAAWTPDTPNGSADAPDAPDVPSGCDFDLGDPDNLQAVWLTFQRERVATCPVTDTPFDVALAQHPAEDDVSAAEVQLACGRCGRHVAFEPPDAKEVFGWAE